MSASKDTTEATQKGAQKSGLLWRLLLILGAVLLVVAIVSLSYIFWQYADAQNRYKEIESVAGLEVNFPEIVAADTQLEELTFDWDALKLLNPDVVGWIIVPGTSINYPIVQTFNNDYYLSHLFDETSSGTGTIFVDTEGSATLDAQNNVLYGHNMLDGSMFADVMKYKDQTYFDEHRTLFLCTPTQNYELSAAAALSISENAPLRQFSFESEAAFTAYTAEILASPLTAAPDLSSVIADTTALYSLVTCETFDSSVRMILCCVPVRSVTVNA